MSKHGTFLASSTLDHVQRYRRLLEGKGVKRLYVERPNTERSLVNEKEIKDYLVNKMGFHPVNPGLLKFSEQVALFKDAEVIVGIMGAAMTNAVFANASCRVVHLAPGGFSDTFFYLLSRIVGQDYIEVRGFGDQVGRDTGFSINLGHIKEALL
uniref:glycosyltransferase family 61 protein n=1 Tax=Neorhizobium sp. SOG26 TaxID=2060726 RepID=UPI0019009F77|nr:glycosyltransferase family 61 protein [Neorhizobium sp. SOG26]